MLFHCTIVPSTLMPKSLDLVVLTEQQKLIVLLLHIHTVSNSGTVEELWNKVAHQYHQIFWFVCDNQTDHPAK